MLFAVLRPEEALPLLGVASVVYVVLGIVLVRSNLAFEAKLLAAGLLTAVLAVWCGQLAAQSEASVQVRAGTAIEGGRVVVGDETAAPLGRIAFVLILGGMGVSVLSRWHSPSAPVGREEASHGNVV